MSREFDDYGAVRRNADECERAAVTLREALGGKSADCMPPLMQMFENARHNVPEAKFLEIVVRSDDAMGEDTAFALPDKQEIHVRQSFVGDALQDSPAARFLGLHELTHIIFHRGRRVFF